jgi:hypothetical protein
VYAKWGVLTALEALELLELEPTEPELEVLDAPLGLIGEVEVGVVVVDVFVVVGKTVVLEPPKTTPPL